MLVLSLFPGLDFFGHAFELEGFTVVRGPDPLWGGDVRRFQPPAGRFDGVIGGPPCQSFSSLVHLIRARGYEPRFGNLIPEFERCIADARPRWFLMENVRQAPEPVVAGYSTDSFFLDNCDIPGEDGLGQEQIRERRFTFGVNMVGFDSMGAPPLEQWIERAALRLPYVSPSVLSRPERYPVKIGGSGKPKKTLSAGEIAGANSRTIRARKPAVTAAHSDQNARPNGGHLVVYDVREALRLQGFPEDYLDDCPLTKTGKMKAIANGVPLPTGRAIARAVKRALEIDEDVAVNR